MSHTDVSTPKPKTSPAPAIAIYHALCQTPIGPLHLFSSSQGLVKLTLPTESRREAETYLQRVLGAVTIHEDTAIHQQALNELAAYFAGTGRAFSVPLDPHGTPFQRLAWDAVAAVPYGETRSYKAIAQAIGRPAAFRAVGAANGANPLPLIIPCHRLVGSNGNLIKYGGGLEVKRRLLAMEQRNRA
jgi:O-6-methylguanine DNA methyltransferase